MSYVIWRMARTLDLPSGIAEQLAAAPTSDFIYSSLSFLRARFGTRQVPGTWFVAALGAIGVDAAAVRQTLFRMARSGILIGEREGRVTSYRPTPTTTKILDAGRARTSEQVSDEWDEQWTIVHLRLETSERERRDRLRDLLLVHGFGRLRSGVYLHPRDKTEVVLAAAVDVGDATGISVFRGRRQGPPTDEVLTRELWDLASLASRYRRFLRRYETVTARGKLWSDREAFALRFAYMFELFRLTWDDPSLPSRFLPANWPGGDARALGESLCESLRPKALGFAEEIAELVGFLPAAVSETR